MSKAVNRKGRRGPLKVRRLPVTFTSDFRRVITRFFDPTGEPRIHNVVERVGRLRDDEVDRLLDEVFVKFRTRHRNIAAAFEENYRSAMATIGSPDNLSQNRSLLIGSYFTAEYSIESAALFNPSIVPHHNQHNCPAGAVRFILSLRATGEGHVSSIVFRTGIITADHRIQIDPRGRLAKPIRVVPDKQYDKPLFRRKLKDIGVNDGMVDLVLDRLGESFTLAQLEHAITEARAAASEKLPLDEAFQDIRWLAQSNYQLELSQAADASELVIFPQTSNESHGIEDLRMVRFVDDDGTVTYYGTCTAFDGYRVLPQLIETRDFLNIGVHTINGACARNKGMALFPAADRRTLRDVLANRRREPVHHGFRHRPFLGDRRAAPDAPLSLGVHADRQLRLAPGDARRLAVADPRRRANADVLHRRHAPGPERSAEGDRLPRRAIDYADRARARRLRAQRRLQLRVDDPQRAALSPVRHLRHGHPLRDGLGRPPAGAVGQIGSTAARISARAKRATPVEVSAAP